MKLINIALLAATLTFGSCAMMKKDCKGQCSTKKEKQCKMKGKSCKDKKQCSTKKKDCHKKKQQAKKK